MVWRIKLQSIIIISHSNHYNTASVVHSYTIKLDMSSTILEAKLSTFLVTSSAFKILAFIWTWTMKMDRKVHIMASYLLLVTFLRFKHYNTDGRSVWTGRGTLLKNKPHLVTFHETILVSLRTSQLTLVSNSLSRLRRY